MEGEDWQIEEGKKQKRLYTKLFASCIIGGVTGWICSLFGLPHVREVVFASGFATFFLWDGLQSKYSRNREEGTPDDLD